MFSLIHFIPKVFAALDCSNPSNANEKLECLFPTQEDLIEASPNAAGPGNEVTLPSGDIATDFIPFFVNTGLSIAGTLAFIAFLYAGYLLIFMNDNDENVEKAKKILTYTAVGIVVMAISYALVYGIATLDLT